MYLQLENKNWVRNYYQLSNQEVVINEGAPKYFRNAKYVKQIIERYSNRKIIRMSKRNSPEKLRARLITASNRLIRTLKRTNDPEKMEKVKTELLQIGAKIEKLDQRLYK